MKIIRDYYMISLLLPVLCGYCLVSHVHAETFTSFSHHATIKAEGEDPFFHFPLTMEVYLHSLSSGLRDLRVFNAAGELVPYALTVKTDIPQTKVEQIKLKGFPLYNDDISDNLGIQLRREKDGSLISIVPVKPTVTRKLSGVILDASHIKSPLVALDISLSEYSQPFQHFSIEASDDLKNWRNVLNAATIAVLEQDGARIEQRQVELPSIQAKYLRLMWLDPQYISSLPKFMVTTSSMTQKNQPDILWTESISPISSAKGNYIFHIGGSVPAERIRFILTQINTLAPAQILVRNNEKQPWRKISDTVLYRLASKGGESISPDMDLGGEMITELQIKLDARGGGIGEKPLQLKIAVRPQQLVFLARGDRPFTLAWGQKAANTIALPLTTLVPGYRYQNGLPGTAASLEINVINPKIDRVSDTITTMTDAPELKRKWLLWSVLLAGAGLLLLMAFKLMRTETPTNQ
jgi:hypothetical protein